MSELLPESVWDEIRPVFAHAFPREAVVAVWGSKWRELENVAQNPFAGFVISEADRLELMGNPPSLFLHSHPNGRAEPSDRDTEQQIATGWTWGIVAITGNAQGEVYRIDRPECWGAQVVPPPLLGRSYLWGVRDCFTLIQDYYREQGIILPAIPRARDPSIYPKGHWGHDQFDYWPERCGLKPVARHDRKPGDACRWKFKADRFNHCAIYLGDGQFLHQPQDKTSEIHITGDEEKLIERFSIDFWRPAGRPKRAGK